MSNVIPFPRTRMLKTKLRLVQYSDVRAEFARRVELRLDEMEQTMEGRFKSAVSVLHSDFADTIPSDTPPGAA